jgi:hypothetical protein
MVFLYYRGWLLGFILVGFLVILAKAILAKAILAKASDGGDRSSHPTICQLIES